MSSKKHNATQASPSQPQPQPPNTIKDEVTHAMNEFQKGNHSEALNLAEDILFRHPNSAVAHGFVCFCHMKIVLSVRNNSSYAHLSLAETLKHIKISVESSKRAVELCPDSLYFRSYHANALFDLADHDSANAGFEAVIEACDAALAMEDPVLMEGFLENEERTRESQIEKLRTILRLFKMHSRHIIDTQYMENMKNEIQEVQDRKDEIEQSAIVARKNFEMGSRKLKNPKKETMETRVKAYWNNTMSMELKKDLLRIRIEDLKLHFAKNASPEAVAVAEEVMQAVEYVKISQNWKFSTCCLCNVRIFNTEWFAEHMKREHLRTLSYELRLLEPEIVIDLVNTTESRDWKPVDVVAAKKMMEDLSRNKHGDEGLHESKLFMNQKDWPYCQNSRRGAVIDKIRARLHVFLKIRCFVSNHFRGYMFLIMQMLKKQIPVQLLKEHYMNQTPLSVCLLDISELYCVLEFLDDLDNTCGLQRLYKSVNKDVVRGELCDAYHEKIVFNEDFSCVVFDKRMLRGELVVTNDGAAVASSADAEIELNDDECNDTSVNWLLKGSTDIGEQLKLWTSFRETSISQGKEFFKIYEAEFERIQNICEKKAQYLRELNVLQNLESICVKEDKRREDSGYTPVSYEYLLSEQRRQTERTNGDNFESDIIWNIFEETRVDSKIKLAIKKQIHKIISKLYKLDAIIRTTTIAMEQTGTKIVTIAAYDHRLIMVPLLKSFMLARLEELANEDAEEKSKAAREASTE
ncbi:hypothetical protein CMV_019864 [Castanea mollissima]|uniref:DUF629 domain-containing protein n=1 Tax=Castanea mollissima TaxID=60419 RepID=A0A8J4QP52_9ROSI|nr:hypothetical protein CMV_019864 [Castanea mollissima]